ncbi:MAG: sigma-70 family RNA polymerase sigma factor [Flavobacterium sp.]
MGNLEDFFKANYKELCMMSFFYTKDIAQAEDLVQDIFVKIIDRKDQNQIKDLSSYLKIAVKNASLKRISYNKQLQPIDDEMILYNESNMEEDNDLALKKRIQLYKQIDSLPEQCKKIFLLCVLEDLKYQEVADTLGISINTVKTQMKKAFKTLRASLKDIYILFIVLNQTKKYFL